MATGHWMVMFPRARVPSVAQILDALRGLRTVPQLRHVGDHSFEVSYEGASFGFGLNDGSWVVLEARELVERNGTELPDAANVATYDARFEIIYDLQDMPILFNSILVVAERLAKLTAGVVYEASNGVFQ